MKMTNLNITEKMYDILKKCGMSEEMINHLMISGDISERTFNDIICGAPVSLNNKLDLINEYMALHHTKRGVLSDAEREITHALAELENLTGMPGAMTYLFAEWYDLDVFIEKSSPVGMFYFPLDPFEYIQNEDRMEQEDASEDDDFRNGDWYRLELWAMNSSAIMEQRYEYYIYNGEICWFNEMERITQEHGNVYYWPKNRKYSSGKTDLNLSTPFRTGDIIRIDCRPFGPWLDAIILEDIDQFDCCHPTILFNVPYTEFWRSSSLIHRHLFYDAECHSYEPLLSPLYRLRMLDESELKKTDGRLLKLKELIGDDSERGLKIWHNLDWNDMTFERLTELIEKLDA